MINQLVSVFIIILKNNNYFNNFISYTVLR